MRSADFINNAGGGWVLGGWLVAGRINNLMLSGPIRPTPSSECGARVPRHQVQILHNYQHTTLLR